VSYTGLENLKILVGTRNVAKEKACPEALRSWLGGAFFYVGLVVVGLQEVKMDAGVTSGLGWFARAISNGGLQSRDFVRSDADEVPRSIKQLSKLAASPEVSATVSTLSEAVTSRILASAVIGSRAILCSPFTPLLHRTARALFTPPPWTPGAVGTS
jgi:hypothetical protein